MKHFDFLKKSLIAASLLLSASAVQAQIHPLAFTVNISGTDFDNWYKNYVGLRLQVVSPAPVAGDKNFTTSNDGDPTNASNWGGAVPPVLIDKEIIMPQAGDSQATTAITVSMAGKVAFVYRGINEFGAKALACQNAGAIACIIVNNVSGGPVGMGAGAVGASVTIPVYMISKDDGAALNSYYHNSQTPHVTITNWGQNLGDDLGFVPGGLAMWHNFAIPRNQLTGTAANPYRGMDGAFIANYGSKPTTNVSVATSISYTPTGGSASTIHTSTTSVLPTFTVADSIYAMFKTTDYDLPVTTGTGRFDVTYTIASDSVDDFPFDNTSSYSFYATDSVFSKGRYDFAKNEPIATIYSSYNGGGEYIWGPMYYVNNAGSSISKIQYSIAQNPPTSGGTVPLTCQTNVFVFKWTDGRNTPDGTFPLDSIMQNGELELVSQNVYPIGAPGDTSRGLINITSISDTDGNPHQVALEANSWYYVAVDIIPTGSSDPAFLGCDGLMSPYPRVFGRFHANGIIDYSNTVHADSKEVSIYQGSQYGNAPHPNTAASFVNSVDSFNYDRAKGALPAVAMTVKPTVPDAVAGVRKPVANVAIFPNPAKDILNVSLEMEQPAKKVSYAIIDGLGRFVSRVHHENVQSEKTQFDIKNLPAGTYFMVISMDNKSMSRTFVIAK